MLLYQTEDRLTRLEGWLAGETEYIVKGFALDDERLKQAGGGGYFDELLTRIRDIRSSEKLFYKQDEFRMS